VRQVAAGHGRKNAMAAANVDRPCEKNTQRQKNPRYGQTTAMTSNAFELVARCGDATGAHAAQQRAVFDGVWSVRSARWIF
jgi:hypothetical protein